MYVLDTTDYGNGYDSYSGEQMFSFILCRNIPYYICRGFL